LRKALPREKEKGGWYRVSNNCGTEAARGAPNWGKGEVPAGKTKKNCRATRSRKKKRGAVPSQKKLKTIERSGEHY